MSLVGALEKGAMGWKAIWGLSLVLMLPAGCAHHSAEPPQESTTGQVRKAEINTAKDQKPSSKPPAVRTNQKVLIDALHIKQKPELARGCEVTSLAMLLNHAGIEVDKMTLANKIKKVPFERNGLKGNMNDGFVGNIRTMSKPGIGVYHGPIKNLADTYLPSQVTDLTGKGFEEVIAQLDNSQPVWVIVTSTFNVVPEQEWETWETASGPLKVTYKMHSVLITGYDSNYLYVNDPLDRNNRRLPRKEFIAGWEQIGRQAIAVNK